MSGFFFLACIVLFTLGLVGLSIGVLRQTVKEIARQRGIEQQFDEREGRPWSRCRLAHGRILAHVQRESERICGGAPFERDKGVQTINPLVRVPAGLEASDQQVDLRSHFLHTKMRRQIVVVGEYGQVIEKSTTAPHAERNATGLAVQPRPHGCAARNL